MNGDVPVKSLKKALDLLSVLLFQDGEEKGFAVKELGERLGLPANSVHNLLKTMAVCGYAEKNADGRYTYGPVCRQIAYRNYQAGDEFHGMLLEIMRGAIRRINESMVFVVLENDAWTVLVRAEPTGKILKVCLEEVQRCYLYEAATGRILYSFSSPERQTELRRANGDPSPSWPDWEKEARKIRAEGSCSLLRTRYDTFSYAVPVFDGRGKLLGAFGVLCPPLNCSPERNAQILSVLKEAAAEVSARLR